MKIGTMQGDRVENQFFAIFGKKVLKYPYFQLETIKNIFVVGNHGHCTYNDKKVKKSRHFQDFPHIWGKNLKNGVQIWFKILRY